MNSASVRKHCISHIDIIRFSLIRNLIISLQQLDAFPWTTRDMCDVQKMHPHGSDSDYIGGITGTAYCELRCDWNEMKVYKEIHGAQKIDPDRPFYTSCWNEDLHFEILANKCAANKRVASLIKTFCDFVLNLEGKEVWTLLHILHITLFFLVLLASCSLLPLNMSRESHT